MEHLTTHSATYREPNLERAMTKILLDAAERAAFMRTKEEYADSFALSDAAKSLLLSIPDEQVDRMAAEWRDHSVSSPHLQSDRTFLTDPCDYFTLPRWRCDG